MSELNQEVIEQLRRSKEQQGCLETVKKDQFGNILSGRHRKMVDVNWPEETVEVKDDLDRELKIIHYNVQRRVSMEETQKQLLKIAEILEAKEVPKETIASEVDKLVPYSARYIRELLPDRYKMIQMARETETVQLNEGDKRWLAATIDTDGNIYIDKNQQPEIQILNTNRDLIEKAAKIMKGKITMRKATEDNLQKKPAYITRKHGVRVVTPILKQIYPYLIVKKNIAKKAIVFAEELVPQKPLVECNRCHMATREATEHKGLMLCPSCLKETQRKPQKAPPKPAPKVEPTVYKPKESWAHRKARMHVQVSHMEERLASRLTEAGIAFESQKEFCIAKCIPDFVIGRKAFFIDGEAVHAKRQEKDEKARTRLAQFYDVEPIGLTYKNDTKTEEDRLFKQIVGTEENK